MSDDCGLLIFGVTEGRILLLLSQINSRLSTISNFFHGLVKRRNPFETNGIYHPGFRAKIRLVNSYK